MQISIYSWNVNGIRAVVRKDTFVPFVEQYQPDILGLQETKAEQGQAEINLPDYNEYWSSAKKKGYSGTAIFSKYEPLAVVNGFPDDIVKKYKITGDTYGDPNDEGRVITAEYDQFYFVTVYTPNGKDDLSRIPLREKSWDPGFLAYMKGLESGTIQLEKGQDTGEQKTNAPKGSGKPVIFCGDLNVAPTPDDLARPKENDGKKGFTAQERAGFQAYLDAGFVDTFRMFHQGNGYYSWWTHWGGARERNVGWRIDHMLVSESLKDNVVDASIHTDVFGSDHCPVSITLDI